MTEVPKANDRSLEEKPNLTSRGHSLIQSMLYCIGTGATNEVLEIKYVAVKNGKIGIFNGKIFLY